MKKIFRCIVLVLLLITIGMTFTACDDGKDYECGWCGREMEHYYDYVNGKYTCYSCSKALRD